MKETAPRRRAMRVNFLVTGFDFLHLVLAYFGIMQGRRPVGAALKDGEVLRLFGDLRDRLDGRRTGADDADALAGEVHRRVRPPRGVIGRALETVPARNGRQRIGREDANGGEQEPRRCLLAADAGPAACVSHLTVFQRRPNWAAPLHNSKISKDEMDEIKSRYEEIYAHCATTPSWFIHQADPRKTLDVPPEEREAFWENLYG